MGGLRMKKVCILFGFIFILIGCNQEQALIEVDPVESKDVDDIPFATFINDEKSDAKEVSKAVKLEEKRITTAKEKNSRHDDKHIKEKKSETHSYMRDINKRYKIKNYEGDIHTLKYTGKYEHSPNDTNLWVSEEIGETSHSTMHEDEDGLYEGVIESEYWMVLPYPIEVGITYEEYMLNNVYMEITDVGLTKQVTAGTFENVVEVTSIYSGEDTYISYFAPNVGTIYTIDPDGEVVFELLEIIP